jgi:hypothetical protein
MCHWEFLYATRIPQHLENDTQNADETPDKTSQVQNRMVGNALPPKGPVSTETPPLKILVSQRLPMTSLEFL